MKITIDKQAFAMSEKATAENFRNEWKSALTDENVQSTARWMMKKLKLDAFVLVSLEDVTITRSRGDVTIFVNVIMRGVNVFVDIAFDFCAAINEDEKELMTARAEVFKRA